MGVDNCLIEINGPEMPIMDGSSEPFVQIIEEAGVVEQDAAKVWYSIDENIFHYDEAKKSGNGSHACNGIPDHHID